MRSDTYGPPMAIAPISDFRKVLSSLIKEIPPQKILSEIPNYSYDSYDWSLLQMSNEYSTNCISSQDAVKFAASNGSKIYYNENIQAPFFRFSKNGTEHEVWFEDVRSIEKKYNILDELSILGAGYWNLSKPFAQNWSFLSSQYRINKFV